MPRLTDDVEISGYDVGEQIALHGPYGVYRGRRQSDQRPVLLKAPVRAPVRGADREGLRREFELLSSLSVSGIPRTHDLIRRADATCLVLEDCGLVPLCTQLGEGRLDLPSFFRIATQLCTILGALHRRTIIHGAISPTSILVGADSGQVQLLNIGLGPGLSAEIRARVPDGAAAYMSPEQTGRINRAIDYRTDFYSLGATFYEMLTGAPPFSSHDSLELIHAHIAKTPTRPALDAVPEQVSRLVLKLLAKAAEDRYQSSAGIAYDLEACQREWTTHATISLFELGRHDVPEQLLIPRKLYGRDREVDELLRAFAETCEGRTAMMLVAGYSGIGKTALIQELHNPIVRKRGHLIGGKFDQVLRNIPYGALAQALRNLVRQLLTESEDELSRWRAQLSDVLGANGGVLAEVVPEIELILGKQAPPPPLDPTEARNRFGYVFQGFVRTVAQKDHPLVVFLDDLQWADAGTLELLHALLTSPDIHHLLLIGAYRDNEVDGSHLLTWAINRLETSGAPLSRLSLGPLALPELTLFLSDTLRGEPAYVEPLARLIQQKTDGNPFFVIQFLKTLEQEGLFDVDEGRAGWSFRMSAIANAGMTDNVIDLMTRKIRRLSPGSQGVLALAACVGNQFDWSTFLSVSRHSPEQAWTGLSECLDAGLIQQVGDRSNASDGNAGEEAVYSFLHDRVQQAAYGLIPEADKKPVHLDLGRLLLDDFDTKAPDDRIFSILNHLNIGSDLITKTSERLSLAQLNLAAGRKAKTSAAYRAACDYLEKGIALVDDSHWRSEYELMFSLFLEAAECQYLAGAFDAAEEYFERLLERAATPLDEAQVHTLRITVYENQSRWADAVASGRAALALFGISFPQHAADKDAALDREVEATQSALGDRSIASLIELPEMADPEGRMAMRILTILWAPAYIAGDEILARLISATIVRLSLTHGITGDSAYGFVTHAITIGPLRREYQAAYQWGVLALNVNARFNDAKLRAKIHQQFQAHVNLWCRRFETCIPHAREACRSGLSTGDFVYAGYGAATEAWSALLISRDLDQFVRVYSPALALLEKIKMTAFFGAHKVILNWALALQGQTSGRLSLSDGTFDEQAFVATYENTAPFFLTFIYTAKLHLCLLFEEFAQALLAAQRAKEVAVAGTIWPVLVDFWSSLAAAAAWETASEGERHAYAGQLASAKESLRELADNCPENFRCAWLLLSAETSRIASQHDAAGRLYEDAVAYARQTDNLQLEALANELAAKFWLRCGQDALAAAFMSEACRCYATWGAAAKVAHLKEHYGGLLGTRPSASTPEESVEDTARVEEPVSLDMSTILKVARAIAVEIEVDGLLRKLMNLALENAGAQRGIFLRRHEGTLLVEAQADADIEQVTIGPPVLLDHANDVSHSVIRYVHRTGEDVVIGNAVTDGRFAGDAYIDRTKPRSILCVPVGHTASAKASAGEQGRLGGILYLENNLTTHAFTPARIEIVRILAAQTAISLENARLYEDMKGEVERRTAAERALREALTQVEALKNRLEAENVYLQEEIRTQHNFNEIVGNSPALVGALRKVERVAATDSTVLIIGETGSGKELFARAVHSRSRRSGRPLVKVNCGAIAPGLVESELFGHVKGAFTGAIEKRIGRFELADGGTIFLDEVGELPLDAQVKLLRVLQEQEFEPVGSSKTVRVSVRVIAATNRNLDQAVREGKFRVDLLYRLNVFPIEVPALRERKSDIGLLVGFLTTGLTRKLGKPIRGFSAQSMRHIMSYSWPGNVRELQNVVERAAILAQGPTLELEGIFPGGESAADPASPARQDGLPVPRGETLNDVQRLHILTVLKTTGGVVEGAAGAAAILGINPNTLRSRMKKLGIAPTSSSSC
jgi:predicted ATPase/transcriptional regulator with GAF, ATPase, and Fis domain